MGRGWLWVRDPLRLRRVFGGVVLPAPSLLELFQLADRTVIRALEAGLDVGHGFELLPAHGKDDADELGEGFLGEMTIALVGVDTLLHDA